jgi:hypothetical protein
MPDATGKLTLEDRQLVLKWINAKRKSALCPVCANNNWAIGGFMTAGVPLSHRGTTLSMNLGAEEITPLVDVICMVCAFTQQFNAVLVGLAAPSSLAEPDEKAS